MCCHSDNSPARRSKGTNSPRFPRELMVLPQAPSSLLATNSTLPPDESSSVSLTSCLAIRRVRLSQCGLPNHPTKVRAISSSFLSGRRDIFPTSVHREIKTLPHISSCSTFKHDDVFCKCAYMDLSVATSVHIYICGPRS